LNASNPAGSRTGIVVQYRGADGGLLDVSVDLIFPGEARTKLAHAAAKPSNRAMPTRFTTSMLMLVYWQAKLLTSLVEIE
jgi:hypothetical protein